MFRSTSFGLHAPHWPSHSALTPSRRRRRAIHCARGCTPPLIPLLSSCPPPDTLTPPVYAQPSTRRTAAAARWGRKCPPALRFASMHAPPPTLPGGVHCVVKLGGSCITEKYRQQQLRPGVLASVVADLAALHAQHPGGSFIVVHGAGSFGHHEASKYGLAQPAGRPQALLREGFAKTRLAITKLNHAVVSALVDAGVPAVGLSPCGTWFRTPTAPDQVENSAGVAAVATLLQQGLVPVLHGDGILELHVGQPPGQLAPSILSGDVIVRRLAEVFSPRFCCFLSDVPGLLSKPPSEPGAELLPLVLVSRNDRGSVTWRACSSSQQQQQPEAVAPQLSAAAFDTTGGIAAKVLESAAVAVEGCPVVIAQGGTPSGTTAVLHGPDAFAATGGSSSSQALQATVVRLA